MSLKYAFAEFEKSPCYTCSMIASLHAHTQEDADNFKFGCVEPKLSACRTLHCLRLSGPPGTSGWSGDYYAPTADEVEQARIRDKRANDEYWLKVAEATKIIED